MTRELVSAIAMVFLAAPQAVSACLYTQAPEEVGPASGQYFATEMLAAATYADLVIVEDDGVRAMDEPQTGILTLRVIARFKGNSADRFTLFGQGLTLNSEVQRTQTRPLMHFTSDAGQVTPYPHSEERAVRLLPAASGDPEPPTQSFTSCTPPPIAGETGRLYVVLRDAEGRLMNSLAMTDGKTTAPNHPAFSFVPVTMEEDDFWLYSVRLAAFGRDYADGPQLLHLKPGSDAARTERAIRAAGGTIRAAYYARGDVIEEVRPSPDEQVRPWLAKAAPFFSKQMRGRIGDPHHSAAELLRSSLNSRQRYGTGLGYEVAQAFTRSVRDVQRSQATPRLIALDVAGDIAALSGLPFAARIAPLDRVIDGLPQVSGSTESEQFEAMQRIDRDIWLLNGGGDNREGILQLIE